MRMAEFGIGGDRFGLSGFNIYIIYIFIYF